MPSIQAFKACLQCFLETSPSPATSSADAEPVSDADLTQITTLLATALGVTVARSPSHCATLVSGLTHSLESLALKDTMQALGTRVYALLTYNEDVDLSDYDDDDDGGPDRAAAGPTSSIAAIRTRLGYAHDLSLLTSALHVSGQVGSQVV